MIFEPIQARRNDALQANPPAGDAHITTHASDWLWAVFSVMLLSLLISVFWTALRRNRNSTFHQIPIIVLTVASLAYFSMASDLGFAVIQSQRGPTRQIWYVRYIQWFINAPLLLLGLLAFTGMSTSDILTTMFFAWVLVICGLVGALVSSTYKWGYYVFGLFALFYIWCRLHGHARRFPFRSGGNFKKGYKTGAGYLTFIWLFYPICWGLSEGSDTISPTSEMVFYGILDLLSGPVFLLLFIWHLSKFEYSSLGSTSLGASGRGEVGGGGAATVGEKGPQPVSGTSGVRPTGRNGAESV
ncbi:family A G protein-coupled receptor-like protein [Paxillus ammoniavirescens]|nr:family A G protein-coupled receptor-like protein [Paxillus ammoniavirescens]